jgi:ABC-type transporter Mla subunit MlaD
MKMALIVALTVSIVPVYAQDRPDIAKLKADAEKVVKMTSGDKQKIQTYCELVDISDQIGQANEKEDREKAEELSNKAEELEKTLGPEFAALVVELNKLEPNSEEAKEIGLILDKLDQLCGDQERRG